MKLFWKVVDIVLTVVVIAPPLIGIVSVMCMDFWSEHRGSGKTDVS